MRFVKKINDEQFPIQLEMNGDVKKLTQKAAEELCRELVKTLSPNGDYAVLEEVSSIDQAKDYLKALCFYKFKDNTFNNYIENKLAGDFAVEIANTFIRERNTRNFR